MKTAEELVAFEARVAEAFNAGRIRAPVHLSGGCEEQLIEIFRNVAQNDWVCTTWRSHYHCLLKGVPEETLFADILAGKSITLCYPEHRIISSAIVGGVAPIAVGLAMAIELAGKSRPLLVRDRPDLSCVWCFLGDMAWQSGVVHECRAYAAQHSLPVEFVLEDNGISVCTPTESVWPEAVLEYGKGLYTNGFNYELPWPHSGAGKRVEF